MKIFVDNGHGCNTAGKRSPDGKHREYLWAREVAASVVEMLRKDGYDADILVPEEYDVPLSVRCDRVNKICNKLGRNNVILVSIHNNAAGIGTDWMNVSGWCVYVYQGSSGQQASIESKMLADCFFDEAKKLGWKTLQYLPAQKWWGKNLKILKDTKCPAVLTENFFQDNRKDVEFISSDKGKSEIVCHHVNAIKNYINKQI